MAERVLPNDVSQSDSLSDEQAVVTAAARTTAGRGRKARAVQQGAAHGGGPLGRHGSWFGRYVNFCTYNEPAVIANRLAFLAFMRLLRGETYDRQKAIADEFIAGTFSEQSVTAKVEAWRAQIADAIEEDPLVDSAQWQESVDALLADLPKFQRNMSLMMSGLITQ